MSGPFFSAAVRASREARDDIWPDTRIARLRELWATGLSTSKIGLDLGVSKNAIIGKARRLDLEARPNPMGVRLPGGPKYVARTVPTPPRFTLPPLASDVTLLPPNDAFPRVSAPENVTLRPIDVTLRPLPRPFITWTPRVDPPAPPASARGQARMGPSLHPCRWMVCDGSQAHPEGWVSCGVDRVGTRSYCAAHQTIATPRWRAEAA